MTAAEIMTKSVVTIAPEETMEHALALMNRMRKRALPVVEASAEAGVLGKLIGFIKYSDPVKAMQAGKGQQLVKQWTRRELLRIDEATPFTEVEALLVGGSTGRVHVADQEGRSSASSRARTCSGTTSSTSKPTAAACDERTNSRTRDELAHECARVRDEPNNQGYRPEPCSCPALRAHGHLMRR